MREGNIYMPSSLGPLFRIHVCPTQHNSMEKDSLKVYRLFKHVVIPCLCVHTAETSGYLISGYCYLRPSISVDL